MCCGPHRRCPCRRPPRLPCGRDASEWWWSPGCWCWTVSTHVSDCWCIQAWHILQCLSAHVWNQNKVLFYSPFTFRLSISILFNFLDQFAIYNFSFLILPWFPHWKLARQRFQVLLLPIDSSTSPPQTWQRTCGSFSCHRNSKDV